MQGSTISYTWIRLNQLFNKEQFYKIKLSEVDDCIPFMKN